MRCLAIALALLAPVASAEIADSAANGFTVKLEVTVKGTPAATYQKFVRNVGDWWSPSHTYSKDPHNLTIDDKPQGCFCEKLPNGGGVRHLQVVYAAPGQAILLNGGMGPLAQLAVTGSLTVQFAAVADGTKVTLLYAVGGYQAGGLGTWAGPVDKMLTETLGNFKAFADK